MPGHQTPSQLHSSVFTEYYVSNIKTLIFIDLQHQLLGYIYSINMICLLITTELEVVRSRIRDFPSLEMYQIIV